MKFLLIPVTYVGLLVGVTFGLDGLSHLTGAWPWFIPVGVAVIASGTLFAADKAGALDV